MTRTAHWVTLLIGHVRRLSSCKHSISSYETASVKLAQNLRWHIDTYSSSKFFLKKNTVLRVSRAEHSAGQFVIKQEKEGKKFNTLFIDLSFHHLSVLPGCGVLMSLFFLTLTVSSAVNPISHHALSKDGIHPFKGLKPAARQVNSPRTEPGKSCSWLPPQEQKQYLKD